MDKLFVVYLFLFDWNILLCFMRIECIQCPQMHFICSILTHPEVPMSYLLSNASVLYWCLCRRIANYFSRDCVSYLLMRLCCVGVYAAEVLIIFHVIVRNCGWIRSSLFPYSGLAWEGMQKGSSSRVSTPLFLLANMWCSPMTCQMACVSWSHRVYRIVVSEGKRLSI